MDTLIKDIIITQKREIELKRSEKYVKRNLKIGNVDNNIIKVIIGPRRAGKSSFAINEINGEFAYVNFDDERIVNLENYDDIINSLKTIYNNSKILFFDEIQNLKNWELFVNRLQRQGYNLIITGSNSNLLSKNLATHLTGRHSQTIIFPFSFKEFLMGEELTESEIKEKLSNYLEYGGFPEPLLKKISYKEYLSTLFDSIVYKDIVKSYDIKLVHAIEDIANYIISNISTELSSNRVKNLVGVKSVQTVEKYIHYMEEAFIFFKINKFSFKKREQITSNKKIYCIDNGFIYAKSFKFMDNLGKLYENVVAVALKKKEMNKEIELYYWKNYQNEEVDFIVKQGNSIKQLIQVCYDLNDNNTKNREIRALLKSSKELNCDNLLVITGDYNEEKEEEWFGIKRKVNYVPLWKWLLNDNVKNGK